MGTLLKRELWEDEHSTIDPKSKYSFKKLLIGTLVILALLALIFIR